MFIHELSRNACLRDFSIMNTQFVARFFRMNSVNARAWTMKGKLHVVPLSTLRGGPLWLPRVKRIWILNKFYTKVSWRFSRNIAQILGGRKCSQTSMKFNTNSKNLVAEKKEISRTWHGVGSDLGLSYMQHAQPKFATSSMNFMPLCKSQQADEKISQ